MDATLALPRPPGPLARLVQETAPVLIALAVHLALLVSVSQMTGQSMTGGWLATLADLLVGVGSVFLFVLGLGRLLWLALRRPPQGIAAQVVADMRATLLNPFRMAVFLISFVSLSLISTAFFHVKAQMPLIAPFSWDNSFADLDRALFLGHTPVELMSPLLSHPLVTSFINDGYHLWLGALMLAQFIACALPPGDVRRPQFLLAYGLIWAVGGVLLAYAFSSAGPVYMQRLGLGDEFAPHMARLAALNDISPVRALAVQEMLWRGYQGEGISLGISAFPSLHNAGAALVACFAFAFSRRLGWAMTAFAGLIFIGSVHLGWHYAVDGIAGLAIGVTGWRLAGRLLAYPNSPWQNSSASHSASTSALVL